jgi:hypothetical protein
VVGEVGRGTFVAGQAPLPPLRLEPFDGRIDLEFNFPTLPDQAALMANSLAAWQQPEAFGAALAPSPSAAWPRPDGSAPTSSQTIAGGRGRRIFCSQAAAGSRSRRPSRRWCRSAGALPWRP